MSMPKSLIFSKLEEELLSSSMSSFLAPRDWVNISTTNKEAQILFIYKERWIHRVAEEVLKFVLAGNFKKVKEILASLPNQDFIGDIILKRVRGRDEMFSKSKQEMVVKKIWSDDDPISPVGAVAWGGEHISILEDLLNVVPNFWAPELFKFRLDAARQLKGIREREDYLAPYKDLVKAYRTFLEYPKLSEKEASEELDVLSLRIGMCQRYLPIAGLREYADDKTAFNTTTFDNAPSVAYEAIIKSFDTGLLGDKQILYKDRFWLRTAETRFKEEDPPFSYICAFLAMNRFCEKRTSALDKIIKELTDPAASSDNKNRAYTRNTFCNIS